MFSGRGRSQNGANTSATEGRADSSRRTIAPRSRLIRPEFKNAVSAERWPGVKSERIGTRDQDLRFTAFPICVCAVDVRMSCNFATDLDHLRETREYGEAQILITSADSLRFQAGPTHRRDGILELRAYHAPAWRDRPPAAVNAAFHRVGILPVLTASAAGEHVPRFTFLVPFESLAVRQEAWGSLEADSEWNDLEAKVTSASIYKLAPYSPLS